MKSRKSDRKIPNVPMKVQMSTQVGVKNAPRGREEIAVQAADDDDETLEPHAGVDAHADEVDDEDVVPAPLEPEELRRKRVAEDHADPPVPPVGTEDAVIERVLFVLVAAIPSDEKFHQRRRSQRSSR